MIDMLKTQFNQVKSMQEIVKEAYFGKSKNLMKAEQQLEVICKQINGCSTELGLIKMNIHESKENRVLEECFRKEFGFRTMNIFWESSSVPNAYTICGLLLDSSLDDHVSGSDRQNNRYYDKAHAYTCNIVIVMNLVRKLGLTARETLSIILHEIGHNFDYQWSTLVLRGVSTVFSLGQNQIGGYVVKHGLLPLQQTIQDNLPIYSRFQTIFQDVFYHLSYMPSLSIFSLRGIINAPMNLLSAILGSKGEYHSDEFAEKYGYGTDMASALDKMDDQSKMNGFVRSTIYSVPVIRTLYNLIDGPVYLINAMLDEHPFNENRILAIKKALEKDLADPKVPKELKSQIRAQLVDVTKIYDANNKMEGHQDEIFTLCRKAFMGAIMK